MINFFIKTYGCQANVADSQALINYLCELNCKKVENEKDADLIIINTCAIREKAEHKLYSYLGALSQFKKSKTYLKIGVIGCVATYRQKEIHKRFDHVCFVFGAKEDLSNLKVYLADIILKLETTKKIYFDQDSSENIKNKTKDFSLKSFLNNSGNTKSLSLGGFKSDIGQLKQSFINIMRGCNNYCSYCIVPFTRGREISYSFDDILNKIKNDIKKGSKEIILLGQNVNSYKDPENGKGFCELLESVARIEGSFWVRFMSPHPKDMTQDVFDVMAKYGGKICGYVHHPLQSGSNKILNAMNRTYTVEKYLEQISWIRKKLPNASISTDIIVGFPGETEEDYLKTREIIEDVRFDNIFSFIYSPRKYTKAALLKDDCSKETKVLRLELLQKRQVEICFEKNSLNINRTLKCLVEKRFSNDKLLARTDGNIRVLFNGDDSNIGNFVNIKIEKAGPANLFGSLIK